MIITEDQARIIVNENRVLTEEILHKYKSNQKLNDGEFVILRAEVQKILNETPEDEEFPNLFGHKFQPIDYDVANIITTRLLLQGEREDRPVIVSYEVLAQGLLDKTRNTPGYNTKTYGAREFENVDMREAFLVNHELNNYFDCYFMKTTNGSPYKAWFYKDYKGVVRYYTKSPYDHYEGWTFDAIDLYGMLVGKTMVLNHEKETYLRHVGYSLIREEQPMNYSESTVRERTRLTKVKRNLNKMNEGSSFKDINQTMYAVLDTLLNEAINRTFEHGRYDEFNRTMFFMSNNEVSKRIKNTKKWNNVKTSTTTINNAINILASLGFIKKLSDEDLFRGENNNKLSEIRKGYAKNGWNQINYYVIRDTPSVYWVNKQLEKLNKKNVNINNVTRKKLTRTVGKELAEKIYVLDNLTVKRPEYYFERKEYSRRFVMAIHDKGFVTKDELSGVITAKNVADKMWTSLVNNSPGQSVRRTTKILRRDLGIDTVGGVFISYPLLHPNQPATLGVKSVEELEVENLLRVYEELTEEVMYWYGDVFSEHNRNKKKKRKSELFEEFLRTGIAPAELLA